MLLPSVFIKFSSCSPHVEADILEYSALSIPKAFLFSLFTPRSLQGVLSHLTIHWLPDERYVGVVTK